MNFIHSHHKNVVLEAELAARVELLLNKQAMRMAKVWCFIYRVIANAGLLNRGN